MLELDEDEKVILEFGKLKYDILDTYYLYNDEEPPVFILMTVVKVPEDLFPHELEISYPIHIALEHAEKDNPSMVKYVRKTIDGFSHQPQGAILAFESLEKEGFDLAMLMRSVLTQIRLRISRM